MAHQKTYYAIVVILFLLFGRVLISCNKYDLDEVCNVKDPLTELEWLKKEVEDKPGWEVYAAILKESSGFNKKKKESILMQTGTARFYYDCEGNMICHSGGASGLPCEEYEVVKKKTLK